LDHKQDLQLFAVHNTWEDYNTKVAHIETVEAATELVGQEAEEAAAAEMGRE
jgi:hypothetical protein